MYKRAPDITPASQSQSQDEEFYHTTLDLNKHWLTSVVAEEETTDAGDSSQSENVRIFEKGHLPLWIQIQVSWASRRRLHSDTPPSHLLQFYNQTLCQNFIAFYSIFSSDRHLALPPPFPIYLPFLFSSILCASPYPFIMLPLRFSFLFFYSKGKITNSISQIIFSFKFDPLII